MTQARILNGGILLRAKPASVWAPQTKKNQHALRAPKPVIAQLVEHLTVDFCGNQMVPGSIPGGRICFCLPALTAASLRCLSCQPPRCLSRPLRFRQQSCAVETRGHCRRQEKSYTWPGSNWRPSACEADVIATRPQVLLPLLVSNGTPNMLGNSPLFLTSDFQPGDEF